MPVDIVGKKSNYLIERDFDRLPEALRNKISKEKEERDNQIDKLTSLGDLDNLKTVKRMVEKIKLPEGIEVQIDTGSLDFKALKNAIYNELDEHEDKIVDLYGSCEHLGVVFLDIIDEKHINDPERRKAFCQFIERLLAYKINGIEKIDEKIDTFWDQISEGNEIKNSDFENAKSSIRLLSKNSSKDVFSSLSRVLMKVDNIKPGTAEHEKGLGGKLKDKVIGAFGFGIPIDKDKIAELYLSILESLKDTLTKLSENGTVEPLVEDKGDILSIIQFYSEQRAENIDNKRFGDFRNKLKDVLDSLIAYYGSIIQLVTNDKSFLEGYNETFLGSLREVVMKFIVGYPEPTLRRSALDKIRNCGYVTIDILKMFIFNKPPDKEKNDTAQWENEIAIKQFAINIFGDIFANPDYDEYMQEMTDSLNRFIVDEKEDLDLRRNALEILINNCDLKYSNFEKIIEAGKDNKDINHDFFHRLVDKLSDQTAEKLNEFVADKGITLFRDVILRTDIESSERIRIINKFSNEDCAYETINVFYEIIEKSKETDIVKRILHTVICKESTYDNNRLANTINKKVLDKDISAEKVNAILNEVDIFIKIIRPDIFVENIQNLLQAVFEHEDISKLDFTILNRFALNILMKLNEIGETDLIANPVFNKILSIKRIEDRVKEIIISKYVDNLLNLKDEGHIKTYLINIENDQENEKLFYRILADEICKLKPDGAKAFLLSEGKDYIKKIILREMPVDQRKKVIDVFKDEKFYEREDLKIFYEAAEDSKEKDIVKYLMQYVLCKNNIYDNFAISEIVKRSYIENNYDKINSIISRIDKYIGSCDDSSHFLDDLQRLMQGIIDNKDFNELDFKAINSFIRTVFKKLKSMGREDFLRETIFYKLVSVNNIKNDIKEDIVNVNIDYFNEQKDLTRIKKFVKDSFLS
ncbi:MAG: hypothetical protein NT178_16705 [Proteobacteria bacterium]|nr:hypothetical protein [Pseudomonadota bacterium]